MVCGFANRDRLKLVGVNDRHRSRVTFWYQPMLEALGDRGESPLIAVVDDDKAVRQGIGALLRALGYRTAAFSSAEEFLSSSLFGHTTCLICDVQMPGVTGLELQAQLIASGHHIPIIFITGRATETEKARALQTGAVGFLTKPVDKDSLVDCLQRACFRSGQEIRRAR